MVAIVLQQVILALIYYCGLIALVRLAGKRLAGQTTTFDLLVLISLGVVLQTSTLKAGSLNSLIFIATVFSAHKATSIASTRFRLVRRLVRSSPQPLVRDGRIIERSLRKEEICREDLIAGLRKLGYWSEKDVKLAVLEETGEISAVGFSQKSELDHSTPDTST
jgi:uncharacterized membrane protein YcaP (DUF421 family)